MNEERHAHYLEQANKLIPKTGFAELAFEEIQTWLNLARLEAAKKLPGTPNEYKISIVVQAYSKEEALVKVMDGSSGSIPEVEEVFYPIQDTDEEEAEEAGMSVDALEACYVQNPIQKLGSEQGVPVSQELINKLIANGCLDEVDWKGGEA